jgi:hypothetical protein
MIHHSIPLRAQHEMCGFRSLNFPRVSQKGGCESLQPSSLANSMLVGSSIPVPTDRINDCVWCCAPAMRGSIGPIPTTHTPFLTPQSTLAYQKVTHTSRNRRSLRLHNPDIYYLPFYIFSSISKFTTCSGSNYQKMFR